MHHDDQPFVAVENHQPVAAISPDVAAAIDTLLDYWLEACYKMSVEDAVRYCYLQHAALMNREEQRERSMILTQVVHFLATQKNAKLAAIGISYAAGLDALNGVTMTEAAAKMGVTRAAISKVANKAVLALSLPRSRYMKSGAAQEAYRIRARRVHRGRLTGTTK